MKEHENAKSPAASVHSRSHEQAGSARPVPPAAKPAVAAPAPAPAASPSNAQAPRTARGRGEPAKAPAAPPKRVADAQASVSSQSKPHPRADMPAQPRGGSAPDVLANPAPPSPLENIEPPGSSSLEQEYPAYMTSRLAGIRKLLVNLGRKSLSQDVASQESGMDSRFEKATVRPASTDPEPIGERGSGSPAASPARVTVQPEFIRPKPVAELEKEKEPLRPTSPHPLRDRPESPDEVETLPSVRGQYRRKRYPPI